MDSSNDFAQQTVQNGIFQMQPMLGEWANPASSTRQ